MSGIVNWWLMWAQIIATHPVRLTVLIISDARKAVAETRSALRDAIESEHEALLSLVAQMAASENHKGPTP